MPYRPMLARFTPEAAPAPTPPPAPKKLTGPGKPGRPAKRTATT